MDKYVQELLFPIKWNAIKLKQKRLRLGLRQQDIADFLGITKASVCSTELGHAKSQAVIMAYGVVLERYEAYMKGYLPGFRKMGTNEFERRT